MDKVKMKENAGSSCILVSVHPSASKACRHTKYLKFK